MTLDRKLGNPVGDLIGAGGTVIPTFDTTDADIVMDGSSFHVVVSGLTASRFIDLPTTGVLKGQPVTIENETKTQDLVVRSSGSNALIKANSHQDGTFRNGVILLSATQDDPTTASHWRVIDIEEVFSIAAAGNFNSGNWLLRRKNLECMISADSLLGHASGNNPFDTTAPIPIRMRPPTDTLMSPEFRDFRYTAHANGQMSIYYNSGGPFTQAPGNSSVDWILVP